MYKKFVKRLLDIIFSLLFLIVLSPLLIISAFLVRIFLGSPVVFSQKRPGKDEKIFKILKFRSMTDKKDSKGNLLPDEQRMTKFGKFVRASSIDELLELWNILKGEMSFVGPRPLLVKYLPLYNETQKRRHECRPGLTGLAQVSGRNAISWEEKFELDVFYVDNISFLLDMKIIFKTFSKVFKREGISQEGNVTVSEFKGTK